MKKRKTTRIYVMQWLTGEFEYFEEHYSNEWAAGYLEHLDYMKKAAYFDDNGIYHKIK